MSPMYETCVSLMRLHLAFSAVYVVVMWNSVLTMRVVVIYASMVW